MTELEKLLSQALTLNNLTVATETQQKLIRYLEMMLRWNKVFNLTAITDPREMVYLHLIDSLLMQPYLHGKHMLDVGSGAGLPGIPLAIMNPETTWVLVDKNNKKTTFLTQVCAELNLTNITPVHQRSEDFKTSPCFDTILSRAYGTLRMFVETTSHLLCPNGLLVAMKGKVPQDELHDIPTGFSVLETDELAIKGIQVERHVICLQKTL